jgi:hypothetical protein
LLTAMQPRINVMPTETQTIRVPIKPLFFNLQV